MDADVEREEAVERATIPDFLSDADLFGTVGVGLPNIEVLFLAAALKYVAAKFPVATVRVWGVIRGQPHGYYIVEAAIDPDRIEDNAAADDDDYGGEQMVSVAPAVEAVLAPLASQRPTIPPEPRQTGVNQHVYFVASSAAPGLWVELPDANPSVIVASRGIVPRFTGNLAAPVSAPSPFPGRERDLLRAMIARISHATAAHVLDAYVVVGRDIDEGPTPGPLPEEVPPVALQPVPDAEDPESIAAVAAWASGFVGDSLLSPAMWVHALPEIGVESGRTTTWQPPQKPDGSAPPPLPACAQEVVAGRLTPLSADTPVAHGGAWAVRRAFNTPSSRRGVYVLRSLRWPGAYTVAVTQPGVMHGAVTSSIYVGTGHPADLTDGSQFIPVPPMPPIDINEGMQMRVQRDATAADHAAFARPPTPDPQAE